MLMKFLETHLKSISIIKRQTTTVLMQQVAAMFSAMFKLGPSPKLKLSGNCVDQSEH